MKIKRSVSLFALIFVLISHVPIAGAFASSVPHVHPRISFEIPIDSADALDVDGDAYLSSDITLSSDIVITKELSLCLNGFSIDMGEYSITVAKDANLSIYDCPESTAGSISAETAEKAAFEVLGSINVIGGQYSVQGRSLIYNKGATYISGGRISGSDVQLVQTIGSAMLDITGGEILASGKGSAVAMVAAPEDETAQKRDYNAAIVGGLVTAESGSPGALVVNAAKGRFVLNTGANIVGKACPAVKVEAGNFEAYGGAVVYSDTDSAIVGTGGNIGLYFATITSDEKYGVDISEDAQLLLSGSLDIVGGSAGVRLAEGKVFSMSDYGFYGDVSVSIVTDVSPTEEKPVPISTYCDPKHYSHFSSANSKAGITYEEGIIYNSYDDSIAHSHDGRNYLVALHSGYSDLNKNNYFLEGDLNCYGFFTGSVVNLCLNGHTLNLGSAIKMYPNSTLNIYDCQGGGKIVCNSTCIQDVNGGGAKLVIHQGTVVSNSGNTVKLSGDDSVIIKGGQLLSLFDGSCAIEVVGLNNSVTVESGSIEGVASAIRVQDAQLTVSGTENGSISGDYAVQCTGLNEGLITVDGSPVLNGETADILLSKNKFIAAGSKLASGEKYSLSSDVQGDVITLSGGTQTDESRFFESADAGRAVVNSEGNILQLVRSLPASPANTEINFGESAEFTVEYTAGGTATYQWYMKKGADGVAEPIEGAVSAQFVSPANLESGNYELYCIVKDESGTYVGDSLTLRVIKDVIENVSLVPTELFAYTGEAMSIQVSASASTVMGRSVSFTYSVDGENYTAEVPMIGPDPGEYQIYYRASAETCDDVDGQFTVIIEEDEAIQLPSFPLNAALSPRLIAILASTAVLLVLCVIFAVQQIKNKLDD